MQLFSGLLSGKEHGSAFQLQQRRQIDTSDSIRDCVFALAITRATLAFEARLDEDVTITPVKARFPIIYITRPFVSTPGKHEKRDATLARHLSSNARWQEIAVLLHSRHCIVCAHAGLVSFDHAIPLIPHVILSRHGTPSTRNTLRNKGQTRNAIAARPCCVRQCPELRPARCESGVARRQLHETFANSAANS